MTKFAILTAAAAIPFMAGAAFAGPYVESKTTGGGRDGDWDTQTELRIGYEHTVNESGTMIYGEVGEGYQWNDGSRGTDRDQWVTVLEAGIDTPLDFVSDKMSLRAKVFGEYGGRTEDFDIGTEVKVRYTF